MATDDIYHVRLELTTWDVNHSISFHVKETSNTADGWGADYCADCMSTQLTTLFQQVLAADTRLEAWYARREVLLENPGLIQLNNVVGAGDTTDSLPPNTCAVFSFRGEDPNLKRAGRFYLGGLRKDSTQAGQIGPSWLGVEYAAIATALENAITDGTFSCVPGVFRKVNNGLPLVPPQFIQHDEVVVVPTLFSQRRRNSQSRGLAT